MFLSVLERSFLGMKLFLRTFNFDGNVPYNIYRSKTITIERKTITFAKLLYDTITMCNMHRQNFSSLCAHIHVQIHVHFS